MNMKRRTEVRELGAGLRLAATLGLILAFFLQGYLIQTHMHAASAATGWSLTKILDGDLGNGPQDKRVPAQDAKCPVCQATAHGQFLTPSAAATLPSLLSVSTILITVEATRLIGTISHSWQGRAPPQA